MLGVFLDTETNGLNPLKHRVIEIAIKAIDLMDGEIKGEFQTVVHQPDDVWERSDPVSLSINGFTKEMVDTGIREAEVAHEVITLFTRLGVERGKAVYICQNPSFDRTFFSQIIDIDVQEAHNWPYHWLDLASMFWALTLRNKNSPPPWEIGISKDKIATHFDLPEEGAPHRAMNGVNHLITCYRKVVGFAA